MCGCGCVCVSVCVCVCVFVGRGKIVLVVAKTMRNPRSALCKTAIMAAADIFSAFGDKLLEPETSDAFDGLVLGFIILLCDLFF